MVLKTRLKILKMKNDKTGAGNEIEAIFPLDIVLRWELKGTRKKLLSIRAELCSSAVKNMPESFIITSRG